MTKPDVEIFPSPQDLQRAVVRRDELDRLVQQKVAEIMAERDALVFEPFFRSRQIAYELKRLQTVPEQEKWSTYYERYGCLDCKTQDRVHAGNGMCHNCRSMVFRRLTQIITEGINGGTRPAGRRNPEERATYTGERTKGRCASHLVQAAQIKALKGVLEL